MLLGGVTEGFGVWKSVHREMAVRGRVIKPAKKVRRVPRLFWKLIGPNSPHIQLTTGRRGLQGKEARPVQGSKGCRSIEVERSVGHHFSALELD